MSKCDLVRKYLDVVLGKEMKDIDARLNALVECKRITAEERRELDYRRLSSDIFIVKILAEKEANKDTFENVLKKYKHKLLQDAFKQIKNYVEFTNGWLEMMERM